MGKSECGIRNKDWEKDRKNSAFAIPIPNFKIDRDLTSSAIISYYFGTNRIGLSLMAS